jgi:hypothetical protein
VVKVPRIKSGLSGNILQKLKDSCLKTQSRLLGSFAGKTENILGYSKLAVEGVTGANDAGSMVTASTKSLKSAVTGAKGASITMEIISEGISSKVASAGVTGTSKNASFTMVISSNVASTGVEGASTAKVMAGVSMDTEVEMLSLPAKRIPACRVKIAAMMMVVVFILFLFLMLMQQRYTGFIRWMAWNRLIWGKNR